MQINANLPIQLHREISQSAKDSKAADTKDPAVLDVSESFGFDSDIPGAMDMMMYDLQKKTQEKHLTKQPVYTDAKALADAQEASAKLLSEFPTAIENAEETALHQASSMTPAPQGNILNMVFPQGTGKIASKVYDLIGNIKPDKFSENPETLLTNTLAKSLDPVFQRFHIENMENSKLLSRSIVKNCNITEAELIALNSYTVKGYAFVNKALREKDEKELTFLNPLISRVTCGLEKLPAHQGQVFRKTQLPEEVLQQHKPGNSVTYDMFLSTSKDENIEFPGNTTVVIDSVSAGKDISWLSNHPKEQEVLFPPNTDFTVLSHTTDEKGNHFIHLRELSETEG